MRDITKPEAIKDRILIILHHATNIAVLQGLDIFILHFNLAKHMIKYWYIPKISGIYFHFSLMHTDLESNYLTNLKRYLGMVQSIFSLIMVKVCNKNLKIPRSNQKPLIEEQTTQ